MCKKRLSIGLAAVFLLGSLGNAAYGETLTAGAAEGRQAEKTEAAEAEAGETPALTVWLDQENEYLLRLLMSMYDFSVELQKGGRYEEYYPEVTWNLVDKSDLAPAEYRQELMDAMEAGGGPDLIYMDEYNGINPLELVSGGYLLPMEAPVDCRGRELQYVAGTLEAGAAEGRQYVLPVSVECPVLFGSVQALEEAGIRTENSYGSLEELLEEVLAAGEKSGKHILENAGAVEWMETCYETEDEDALEKMQELFDRAREQSGTDEDWFAASEGIRQGTCLLAGCGVMDYRQMCQNLALLPGEELAFFSVPSEDGVVRGVIQESFGINANTEHPEAERVFQTLFQLPHSDQAEDYPAIAEDIFWKKLAQNASLVSKEQADREQNARKEVISDDLDQAILACSRDAVTDAVFARQAEKEVRIPESAGHEKKIITVMYEDGGRGEKSPVKGWLSEAAAKWEQEHGEYHVQLLAAPTLYNTSAAYFGYMENSGLAPDILLNSVHGLEAVTWADSKNHYADLEPLLQEYQKDMSFLPDWAAEGVTWKGTVSGIPYSIRLRPGIWYSRELACQAGLPADWAPQNLEELGAGLGMLKQMSGNEVPCVLSGSDVMRALSFMAVSEPEEMAREEDGKWRVSREAWIRFLAKLQELAEEDLLSFVTGREGAMTEAEAAKALAEGTLPAVISDWAFGSWYNEVPEGLAFAPLGTVADVDLFTISEKSEYQKEALAFCLLALQNEEYEKCMKAMRKLPLTEGGESVRFVLPYETAVCDFEMLAAELMDSGGETPEELAEQYPMYEWLE